MRWKEETFADELLRYQNLRYLCILQINGRRMTFSFFWPSFYHPGAGRKRGSHFSMLPTLHYFLNNEKNMHSSLHVLEWKTHIKIKPG